MEHEPVSIGVILASVRAQRRGEAFARWALDKVAGSGPGRPGVTVELLDLRDWPIPPFDHLASAVVAEKSYAPASVAARWAQKIAALDGFVIVTPEYNQGYPGQLKNALDQIYAPWNYKPVAFVAYGGGASGTRATQQLRQVVIELRMIPVRDDVGIRLAGLTTDERGWPTEDFYAKRGDAMANELVWWTRAAKDVRARRSR